MALPPRREPGYIGGRSGGTLAAPQKQSGGQGGRAYINVALPVGRNKHFGHGKSKKKNVRSNVKKTKTKNSHFQGGRFDVPLPLLIGGGTRLGNAPLRISELYMPHEDTSAMPQQSLIPPMPAFRITATDHYHFVDTPTPHLVLAHASLPCLLTGVWPEGHRNKVSSGDSYTHIALVDPTIDVHDEYTGYGQVTSADQDRFAFPVGQTQNLWYAVFSFVTVIPGIGRRRAVLLDRQAPGSWTGGVQ